MRRRAASPGAGNASPPSGRLRARAAASASALLFAAGCGGGGDGPVEIRFWAMGREGEVVREIVREFESENPDVRVRVQQVPWSAAHEKLLTAHVGDASPDVAQLGNTWIAEFVALRAIESLDPFLRESITVGSASYFPGMWETNEIEGSIYGVPWYVDTRVLFYRTDILAEAGYDSIPETWAEWRSAMEAVKRVVGPDRYAVFLPLNEPTQPVILGLQNGSTLLAENATRGAFSEAPFRDAFAFYDGLFRDALAPPVTNTEIANLYQEFERGRFAMYVTGPWNLGEFARRLPPEMDGRWSTAPLPGPSGPGVSLAGGSSLVLFRSSERREAAWRLIEFLSRPERQVEFYRLSGDLPARLEAWEDPAFTDDPRVGAFWEQLHRVVPAPKIPEWEQIYIRVQVRAEQAVRGAGGVDGAIAALDDDANRILEKRRWLLEREEGRSKPKEGGGA